MKDRHVRIAAAPIPGSTAQAPPRCGTGSATRPVTLAVRASAPVCQNCRSPQDFDTLEISRMVTHDGELEETPLLAIRHFCRDCVKLMITSNWDALSERKAK